MSKVFVPNKGPHDYSEAEAWGRLTFCTEGNLDRRDVNNMYRDLMDSLADSTPDDWILITSLTSLCSVACGIFSAMHGRLNLLMFDQGSYVSRSLTFPFHNKENTNAKQSSLKH